MSRPARIEDLMEGLDNKPHQAISLRADDAWWYERKESIEVYFQLPDRKGTVSCRIHIDDLEDWIRRARNLKSLRALRRTSTRSKA